MRGLGIGILIVGVGVASGCGGSSSTSSSTTQPATSATTPAASTAAPASTQTPATTTAAVDVALATDKKGARILVAGNGRTLYSFDPDTKGGKSVCYGACAAAWPPLIVSGTPKLGPGVDASLIGTLTRKDATRQLTFGGWPMYYFAFDKAAGDINGQSDQQVWWTMTSTGQQMRLPATIQAAAKGGKMVTDNFGWVVYTFVPDKGSGKSVCRGACAATWSPVTTTGTPIAGAGLTGKLGTYTRPDGSVQVTLNGWPLYYFANDATPGQTNGQGIKGVWWEATPAGKQLRA